MKIENITKIDELWRSLPMLKLAGEAALLEAKNADTDMGAVNWGDLGVTGAGVKITEDGDIFRYIEIEEASPEAGLLRQFVHSFLRAHGFDKVNIEIDW